MKTLISIDPGQSTGLIAGTYSEDTPFELTHAFQVEGGLSGFLKQVRMIQGDYGEYGSLVVGDYSQGAPDFFDLWEVDEEGGLVTVATVLVEKFSARGAATGPFALKTNALEPLKIEGALEALRVPMTFVQPAQQYFLPGESKAKKKQAQHKWLRENGYAIMPKDLGTKDADDARSATAHAISWLRRQKHEPTLEMFRKESK